MCAACRENGGRGHPKAPQRLSGRWSALARRPITSSLSPDQVLFLGGLSLSLGDNHLVTWELLPEDSQRFNCHPEDNADESKCLARGCIWKVGIPRPSAASGMESGPVLIGCLLFQPSTLEKAPWCFYPEDYGYSVTTSQETSGGMTATIIRNKKYRSSGRPNSTDIDLLRVQIYYHSGHMLQFKVLLLCPGALLTQGSRD